MNMPQKLCPVCEHLFYAKRSSGYSQRACSRICRDKLRIVDHDKAILPFHDLYTVTENGCWEWKSGFASFGYGSIRIGGRKIRAHRYSYEIHVAPIPHGMVVCHKCDNPPCVNPDHLFIGTMKDNTADMIAKGRSKLGSNHAIGSACKSSKITPQIAYAIKCDRRPHREVALRYGVSASLVGAIKNGKLWVKALDEAGLTNSEFSAQTPDAQSSP